MLRAKRDREGAGPGRAGGGLGMVWALGASRRALEGVEDLIASLFRALGNAFGPVRTILGAQGCHLGGICVILGSFCIRSAGILELL